MPRTEVIRRVVSASSMASSRTCDSGQKSAALATSPISRRSALLRGSVAMLVAGWGIRSQAATGQSNAEHYVVFEGPINDTNTSRLISVISTLIPKGLRVVHLVVGTGGGSIADALLAYGLLRALPVTLITYNLSTIASAGTIIYLTGEKRIATPNAFFLFHQVRENFSKPPASMTLDEFTEAKASLAMDAERMEEIYRQRTSLTPAQIEEFRQHAVFFDAAAAHNAGIVQEVAALHIPPGAAITVVNTAPTPTPS
jgi:ATP-dependent protease ClpP protease subunit